MIKIANNKVIIVWVTQTVTGECCILIECIMVDTFTDIIGVIDIFLQEDAIIANCIVALINIDIMWEHVIGFIATIIVTIDI